ncbi:PhzF family phenazine biosynthesis protein [Nocardia sp. CDC159]|uniref:PhzF family phenazine biosynthesis protein n=1 Tax=Nocardia pulmonis TaxID=2951408 RepID=A0A9X2IVU9_9NOCA|nr:MULTISPECIES: PhzF family phenazine biosynthesis protein [Nocardia]MCM6774262.1 PhzF family phenazine biosynthesis protein [Nocardia pulmonis]MCM6787149.1 PhzF family phenazine biosynthesis protein [Nocardia sp. CDC159]
MGAAESDSTQIEVVRVFTDAAGRFGNPLGIARADEVVGADHQALAARAGYSETIVVDKPADGRTRMRIYTPTKELPFAGHPSVGAAWWLSSIGHPVKVIEVPAGPVEVEAQANGLTWIRARAEWTPNFTVAQFASLDDLLTLQPVDFPEGQHYVWAWIDEQRGSIRSRMFAPAMGIAEDEATGAAAVAITGLLRRGLIITQGRGSQIFTEWDSDGWVRLGGRVVPDYPVII